MKDIVTLAVVNCAPLWSEAERGRIAGYVCAAAKRGAELIVFPALRHVDAALAEKLAGEYQTAVACGLDGGDAVLCLPEGGGVFVETGWGTARTLWGSIALAGKCADIREVPPEARLALLPRAEEQDFPDGNCGCFCALANSLGRHPGGWFSGGSRVVGPDGILRRPAAEGAGEPSLLLLTLDLSESEAGL